jgi:hypothetical protein
VAGLFDLPTVGTAAPLGASLTADGVNFAVYAAPEAHAVNLCLFTPEDLKAGKPPTHEIPLDAEANRTGNVWHVHLPKCSDQLLYGYRVDGPKNEHKGQLFDKDLVLLDPYATATVAGDRTKYGVPSETAKPGEECWPQYAGAVPSRDDVFDWEGVTSPAHKMADLCVYETHVRGLTASDPGAGRTRRSSTKLPYLKRMGFNALELMPIAEFNELEYYSDNPVTGEKRYNFWGYSTVNFFSPKQLFAKSAGEDCGRAANRELKTMVRECHRNGIEVILDVVFNHTAEGNERGLTLSLRGFDNRTYYMVAPEGQFYNYSGCGNTVNCNHPDRAADDRRLPQTLGHGVPHRRVQVRPRVHHDARALELGPAEQRGLAHHRHRQQRDLRRRRSRGPSRDRDDQQRPRSGRREAHRRSVGRRGSVPGGQLPALRQVGGVERALPRRRAQLHPRVRRVRRVVRRVHLRLALAVQGHRPQAVPQPELHHRARRVHAA